jgi:TonB family protein
MLPFGFAKAQWIEKPKPEFPLHVFHHGMQGSVVLSLTLNQDGRVTSARVIRSSGYSSLDQLAREVSMKWRLAPSLVVPTDLTVGRLHMVKFRQPHSGYAKALVPGSSPLWAESRRGL